jgi:hypothetical protein
MECFERVLRMTQNIPDAYLELALLLERRHHLDLRHAGRGRSHPSHAVLRPDLRQRDPGQRRSRHRAARHLLSHRFNNVMYNCPAGGITIHNAAKPADHLTHEQGRSQYIGEKTEGNVLELE